MTMEALPQDLADFLVTRNFDSEYFDAQGQPAEAGEAKTMKFDYVAGSGRNYGTAVCVIADDELSLFYGDNLGRGMEPEDKEEWFSFLEELSNKAASHSAIWSPRDINQLKHTLAGIAAIKEGLFEGYYGNRKVSYMGEQTQARLVINHNRALGENDKRYRYVESLFIETADQERFRLPFKSLSGGRAMLEHVRSGGKPYDVRGNHISEIVSEMAVLSRFNRAQHNRVFEGITQELVESAREYYHNLQETMKRLGSSRGYQAYFETWAPDRTGEAEALVENLRDLFVEQTLDARIEAALPTLAKIQQQGNNMKEAEIFENWINNLSEGTWALPDTPESQEKLNQLMSAELIVGPDATNATELLYDVVGDDELFDILNDLADKSQGRANIWDDSDVQRRLAELGVQTPQSTQAEPANVAQDTAPAQPAAAAPTPPVAEGDNLATFTESNELALILKHAGVPIKEGVLTDSTGSTLEHIKDTFRRDVKDFERTGEMSDHLFHALYDYYFDDMPYGTKKARDGDPHEWISDRFAQDIGLEEGWKGALAGGLAGSALGSVVPALGTTLGGIAGAYAGHKIGDQGLSDPDKQWKSPSQEPKQQKPVSECNYTMEGDYCPEHGLAECGQADGGAVGMPYSMGEGVVGNMFNKAKSMFTKPAAPAPQAAPAAPAPVVPAAAAAAPGAVKKGGTMDMTKKVAAPATKPAAAPAAPTAGKVQGIKSNVDVNTLQKFNGIVDVSPKIKPQIKDAGGVTWTKTNMGWTDGKRSIDPKDSTYQSFDDAWRVANGAQPGNVGVPGAQQPAVAEGNNDPINSNSAMTGSYYEGKESKSQEGDALLARIKSLALLR